MAEAAIFTHEEMKTLILALAHGQRHFSEDDVAVVAEWARELRLSSALLSLVLDGSVHLRVVGGEVQVFHPGRRRGRQIKDRQE